MPGIILLILRTIVFLIFVAGILRTMTESVGRIRNFIKRFGLVGGVYLISWPLTVVLVELLLPVYMHQ